MMVRESKADPVSFVAVLGEISAALADAARRFGATIRTELPVETVLVENSRACGVRLQGGEELRAPLIVSSADPKRTFLRLVDASHIPNAFRR
jgi:phytoene dehydrogenase-like protein